LKGAKPYNTVQLLIFFNLLLAVIAFIKDILIAAYFGTSHIADAINLAFFLPDTIGNNIIGAGIAVASIPVLTKLAIEKDEVLYHSTIQKLAVYVFGGTLLVLSVMILFAVPLFKLFHLTTGGISADVLRFFYMMSPIIVAAPCWLLGSSILQASKRFVFPAITPILYNIFLLLSLFICQLAGIPQTQGGKLFSTAMTAATMLVGILTWYFCIKKQKLKWNLKGFFIKSNSLEINKIRSTFIAYIFILFFGQAALFFERIQASTLETGTIAALSYAYRISQFPIWVFIAAVNTFILPTISIHVVKNDIASLKRDITKSFIFVILVSVFLSLLLVLFSEPLIKIVLARGSFNLHSVKLTSTILKGYGLSIVGQSLYVFCTRYYIAEGKMRIPFVIGLVGSILNIVLLKFLVPSVGAVGIGYAVAIASTFNGVLILIYFIKNLFAVEQRGRVTYE
jgi:murein biosynthesis integral membrane protein MurJ